jgi:ribonuclease T1
MAQCSIVKKALAVWCVGALLVSGSALVPAATPADALAVIRLSGLPEQAMQTYALIHRGGPFASAKDGVVFGNRERLLPSRTRGYYREYTVPTPGLRHRGKKRMVCGGPPRVPDVCYYTADHYASFRRIEP